MEPLQIKSGNVQVKERREAACRKVFEYFKLQLSELSLLCFIDDETVDDADYERERSRVLGVTNRGGFMRDVAMALAEGVLLPSYVKECLFGVNSGQLFQKLIYVHGTACA